MSDGPVQSIVIVGGGISGLSAAYRLKVLAEQSSRAISTTLVEASGQLGGKLQTEYVDGLTIEAGPDSFLSYKPAAIKLARDIGIDDRIIGTRESGGGTFILRDGALEPLPEGITMMVPSRIKPLLQSRLLSTRAKLRMAAEYFIPPRLDEGDEAIGGFVTRRLGREAYERMAQPLLSGIYAGDADQLSLAATFPRLREVERTHGSMVRGMLAQRKAHSTSTTRPALPPFVSFKRGMAELVDGLVASLDNVELRTNSQVDAISAHGSTYQVMLSTGECLYANAVLLATPAYESGRLLRSVDGQLASLLTRIPYVSTATISLAYRRREVDQFQFGRGFVIPSVENRELTAVTWASNKFEHRAPDDLALIRTFVGRAGREEAAYLEDDALLNVVRSELQEILGVTAQPVLSRIYRWQRAMPQYLVGHLEKIEQIERLLERSPGVFLLGAGYRGVGIPDCIESGYRAAEMAWERLDPDRLN